MAKTAAARPRTRTTRPAIPRPRAVESLAELGGQEHRCHRGADRVRCARAPLRSLPPVERKPPPTIAVSLAGPYQRHARPVDRHLVSPCPAVPVTSLACINSPDSSKCRCPGCPVTGGCDILGVLRPVGVADLRWVACAEGDSPCVPALTPGRHAHFPTPSATRCRPPTPWYDTPPTQSGPLRRVVSFPPQVRNGVRLNQRNHSGAVCAGSNPAEGTSSPPRRTSGIGTPLLFSFRRCLSPRWSCASRPVRRDPHPASQACQSRATSSGAPGLPPVSDGQFQRG